LERPFFVDKLQWHPETNYFNAGVLLINLTKWHQDNFHIQLNKISTEHSTEFLSADQTLLNLLVKGDFFELPRKLNVPSLPHRHSPAYPDVSTSHFPGSPKPWDIFGIFIHSGYHRWRNYTPGYWQKNYSRLTFGKLIRTWYIRKNIFKKY